MPEKAWKQFERRVAAWLEKLTGIPCKRVSLSGSNNQQAESSADSDHPTIYAEAKQASGFRASTTLHNLVRDTRKKATKEGKVPIVCIQAKNCPGFVVCIHSEDFEALLQTPLLRPRSGDQFSLKEVVEQASKRRKKTGTFCIACGEPQYESPSGPVCKNGHGGAEGVVHTTEGHKRQPPKPKRKGTR